jgi:hypothetical protein
MEVGMAREDIGGCGGGQRGARGTPDVIRIYALRHTACFISRPKVQYPNITLRGEALVDIILIIAIILLLLGLLGVGGVIHALGSIAWVLLIIAVIVIAWRVITGRRPVA